VVAENVVRYWHLAPLVAKWGQLAGGQWPKVIAGLGGPPDRRYIVGALAVRPGAAWNIHPDGTYEAPEGSTSVDSHRLRGRLVGGALFSNYSYGLYIWVDGAGIVQHLPKR